MSKPPIKRVSAGVLRKMFNDGKYCEKVQNGTVKTRSLRSPRPKGTPGQRCPVYLLISD